MTKEDIVKDVIVDIITNQMDRDTHPAFTGISINSVSEVREDGIDYLVGHATKDGVSIGSISIKRSDVIDYIRDRRLKELGI